MSDFDDKATVSGSVVSIENGADEVGAKSCVVTIPASLSGVSLVTETQTGRNLLNGEDAVITTNNIRFYYSNGKYYSAGTYTLSISENVSGLYVRNVSTSTHISVKYNSNFITFTLTEKTLIGFDFYKVGINQNDNIMLEYGSTVHAYEPYQTPTTYTASLGRTIYGGTADIVNGEGEETFGYIVFDGSENWGTYPSYNGYYIGISDMESGTRQDGLCNQLTCSKSNAQGQTNAFWLGVGNKNLYIIGVYDSMGNTLEAFKDYLAEHPLILVYPLDTPTDFTFTGQEVPTRLGYNAFWSDEGDTELTYYKSGYGYTSVTVHKETPDGEPVEQTAKLHKVIYAGEVDVIKGTAKPKNLLDASTGTGTGTIWYYYDNGILLEKDKSYTFSCGNRGSGSISFYGIDHTTQLAYSYIDNSSASVTFTPTENVYVCPRIYQAGLTPETVVEPQLEAGATPSEFVPHFDPFTFPPISMETDEGENTLFADEGDSSIIYRKQAE